MPSEFIRRFVAAGRYGAAIGFLVGLLVVFSQVMVVQDSNVTSDEENVQPQPPEALLPPPDTLFRSSGYDGVESAFEVLALHYAQRGNTEEAIESIRATNDPQLRDAIAYRVFKSQLYTISRNRNFDLEQAVISEIKDKKLQSLALAEFATSLHDIIPDDTTSAEGQEALQRYQNALEEARTTALASEQESSNFFDSLANWAVWPPVLSVFGFLLAGLAQPSVEGFGKVLGSEIAERLRLQEVADTILERAGEADQSEPAADKKA